MKHQALFSDKYFKIPSEKISNHLGKVKAKIPRSESSNEPPENLMNDSK